MHISGILSRSNTRNIDKSPVNTSAPFSGSSPVFPLTIILNSCAEARHVDSFAPSCRILSILISNVHLTIGAFYRQSPQSQIL